MIDSEQAYFTGSEAVAVRNKEHGLITLVFDDCQEPLDFILRQEFNSFGPRRSRGAKFGQNNPFDLFFYNRGGVLLSFAEVSGSQNFTVLTNFGNLGGTVSTFVRIGECRFW